MTSSGPGKFGGSRKTVRKRAQRKRKNKPVRNDQVSATTSSRPVLSPKENNVDSRMESLAYEAVTVAMQLKKSFNNSEKALDSSSPIIQDASRAMKILNGLLKENKARNNYENK
jgi:hypothetical protein